VVLISPNNSPTFFSPWHKLLMIFRRIGADITRNISAALSNTWSDSENEGFAGLDPAVSWMGSIGVFTMG
jgi:hypothetical protein